MKWKHCINCGSSMIDTPDGDPLAIQRCSVCEQVNYDNPTPVAAAIVELPNGIVLVRNHGWPKLRPQPFGTGLALRDWLKNQGISI